MRMPGPMLGDQCIMLPFPSLYSHLPAFLLLGHSLDILHMLICFLAFPLMSAFADPILFRYNFLWTWLFKSKRC